MEERILRIHRIVSSDTSLSPERIGEEATKQLVEYLEKLANGEYDINKSKEVVPEYIRKYTYPWDCVLEYTIPGNVEDPDFDEKEKKILQRLVTGVIKGKITINVNIGANTIPKELLK